MRREPASKHGFGDSGNGGSERERGLHCPHTGALRPGLIDNDVDERLARGGIGLAKNLRRDFNEVRLEFTGVPLREHIGDFGWRKAGATADEVVCLGNKLHVGVFDAVVNHFDEVTGAVCSDVGDARLAFGDGGDGLEDRSERFPCLCASAGHYRRASECTLFAARNTSADKVDARFAHSLFATNGVGEQCVSAIDNDVARFENFTQLVDDGVGSSASLDHDDRGARGGERCGEVSDRLRGNEISLGMCGDESLCLVPRTVVHGDAVALTRCEVASEVRPHHGKPNHTDICLRHQRTPEFVVVENLLPAYRLCWRGTSARESNLRDRRGGKAPAFLTLRAFE
ncbi:unannotated protein [freshwater metagenome]|uniref:Unannotated protein n=1 Tax=freshwater metagenome TaxID=449393 RepID=A0A6J6GD29_9ZZZZ